MILVLSALIFPSRPAASSAYWIWSRPWVVARKLSPRPSFQAQGRPVRVASSAHSTSPANNPTLLPTPPPMSGASSRSNQFGLLARLYGARLHQELLPLSALAERQGMDPTTLDRSLKPLEAAGLIG